LPGHAAAGTDNVENMLLQLINQGRGQQGRGSLVMHAGLRDQVRRHSGDMIAQGRINHEGASSRISDAAPDPAEPNGAPDDGFAGSSGCENVASRNMPGESEQKAAQGLYTQWVNSPPHRQCMFDEQRTTNVIGIGVARDSDGGWWATLMLTNDATPPAASSSSSGSSACPGHEGDQRAQVVGTNGSDVLVGTPGAVVCGLGGNDVLRAAAQGGSLLEAGDGFDILCARQGSTADVLDGGAGVDRARFDDGERVLGVERFASASACG
jgi:hypothetical protein